MRRLTKDELQKIQIEEDMLKGNINRMCVTDELGELESMRNYAISRINRIYNTNLERLSEVTE